jgi:hypothetical protein
MSWGSSSDPWGNNTSVTPDSAWGTTANSDSAGNAYPPPRSSSSWDNSGSVVELGSSPTFAYQKPATWLPAWFSLGAAILAVGAAFFAHSGSTASARIVLGIAAYVLGALVVSILWNWQRASDTKARSRHASKSRFLGMLAQTFATVWMFVGLAGAFWAAWTVANELAKL